MKGAKMILCVHRYAPELNRALLAGGGALPIPGITTIREARARLFPKPAPGIWAEVTTHYDEARFKGLERRHTGRVASRTEALRFARDLKAKNPGGALVDGTSLPPLKVSVRTRLVD